MQPAERPLLCSWSGGKDSALALWRASGHSGRPAALLTMMAEGGARSRSHGLSLDVLRAQADALGLPLRTREASWAGYEAAFLEELGSFAASGVRAGVFGDIDVEPHRAWVRGVCERAGVEPLQPLWQEGRAALLAELLEAGFRARIVAARAGVVPCELLGRELDAGLVIELTALGIDACGEGGEYHTVVVDGPLFRHSVELEAGEAVLRDGVWFLDLRPAAGTPAPSYTRPDA